MSTKDPSLYRGVRFFVILVILLIVYFPSTSAEIGDMVGVSFGVVILGLLIYKLFIS